jgi:hypothetical protein
MEGFMDSKSGLACAADYTGYHQIIRVMSFKVSCYFVFSHSSCRARNTNQTKEELNTYDNCFGCCYKVDIGASYDNLEHTNSQTKLHVATEGKDCRYPP